MQSSINRVHLPNAIGYHTDNDNFVLTKDLVIKFDGLTFRIKKGYKTDGASNPFGGRFSSGTLTAAIVHDIFYGSELYSRAVSDNNFLFLMRKNGVSFLKRTAYFLAVRLFGWFTRLSHTVGSVENARQYLQIKRTVL